MSSTFLQTRQQVGGLAHTAWRKPWSVWIFASCKSAPHATGVQDTAVTLLCRESVFCPFLLPWGACRDCGEEEAGPGSQQPISPSSATPPTLKAKPKSELH